MVTGSKRGSIYIFVNVYVLISCKPYGECGLKWKRRRDKEKDNEKRCKVYACACVCIYVFASHRSGLSQTILSILVR